VVDGVHERGPGTRIDVHTVEYGDLTGDGDDEAVVLMACAANNSARPCPPDAVCLPQHPLVFTVDGSAPGGVRMLYPLRAADQAVRAESGSERLVLYAVAVDRGQLVTSWYGWAPADNACCSSRDVTLRHRWAGSSWQRAAPVEAREQRVGGN
jgi:hypothetical protein